MTNPTPNAASAKANAQQPAEKTGRRRLMSRGKVQLGLGLTGVLLLGWLVGWWFTRPVQMEPAEQVALALQLLDAGKYQRARAIAKRLDELGYVEPGFTGVLEFIQGMATFHLAEADAERSQFQTAVALLREAEQRALDKQRRPEWAFALGASLYQLGDYLPARSLLEEALESYPSRRHETSMMLTELYLDPGIRTPDLLADALKLMDAVAEDRETTVPALDQARLYEAEIQLTRNNLEEAADALELLSDEMAESPAAKILEARILIQGKDYADAIELLLPIYQDDRVDETVARETSYVLGLAEDELAKEAEQRADANEMDIHNHRESARMYFERTASRYGQTAEGTAAYLRWGRLLREAGVHEKALECYGAALKSVHDKEEYRNCWLSREQFRQSILEAWNGWLASRKHYSEAIALSEMMTPLFPQDEAYELAARVHERWAEEIEDELKTERFSIRMARQDELRRQWRLSGEAYMRLAEARVSSAQYPDALWRAAEHFRRCHEFSQALKLINQFIATEPDRLMAAALVQRSRLNLDLDQLSAALDDLRLVIATYPTDPSIFTAAYLIGTCHFEQNKLDDAEAAWRSILTSEKLSPTAVEWRDAQLALGRLLFEKGEAERRKVIHRQPPVEQAALLAGYTEAFLQWQEAAALLSEYLIRSVDSDGATEARYYLGQALERQADWFHQQYLAAETDNARLQLEKQHDLVLEKSLREFEKISAELQPEITKDRLDDVQRRMLKNCVFEIPHTLYRLRRYEQAIADYNTAANRYPNDAQTLVAYIQMAQCYHRLQKPVEAGSMLATAKSMLNQRLFPDSAFEVPSTNFNREQWQEWLDRARQVQ